MDPNVYSAAMKGEFDNLADKIGQLDQEQTLYNNTVLHIAARYGQTEFVEKLLRKMDPSILWMLLPAQNRMGDTALHVAARGGHLLIIKALITRAKELDGAGPENGVNIVKGILTSENEDNDTALHEALRTFKLSPQQVDRKTVPSSQGEEDDSGSTPPAEPAVKTTTKGNESGGVPTLLRMVTGLGGRKESSKAIAEATDIDVLSLLVYPHYAYRPNKAGETPLYLAAELHGHQVVGMITGKLPRYEGNAAGPGGRTAMHAAVIRNNKANTAMLLEWNEDLASKQDVRGWTPLHYAAESGLADRVKQLLLKSVTLGYQITGEEDGKNTALHLAARGGHVPVLKEVILRCPGCWDIVNAKGQNMLHVAVELTDPEDVIDFFQQNRASLGSLLNQKDNDGNTPLHLALATELVVLDYLSKTDYSRLDKTSYNNDNRSVMDILATSIHGSRKEKEGVMKRLIKDGVPKASRNSVRMSGGLGKPINKEGEGASIWTDMEKMFSTQMLVATLVATATFAVGISIPGSYNGQEGPEQGIALLLRQQAFKAFVATDVLAMMFSTAAMLLYLSSYIGVRFKEDRNIGSGFNFFITGMGCTITSVVLMVLAFITGSFAVLAHLPSLAVTMCVISSIYCVCVALVELYLYYLMVAF